MVECHKFVVRQRKDWGVRGHLKFLSRSQHNIRAVPYRAQSRLTLRMRVHSPGRQRFCRHGPATVRLATLARTRMGGGSLMESIAPRNTPAAALELPALAPRRCCRWV